MSPSRPETGADMGARRCPICGRAAAAKFKPFCSKRCADVDLARWLGGGYAIAGDPADKPEGEGDGEEKP